MITQTIFSGLLALAVLGPFPAQAATPVAACAPVLEQGWLRLPPAPVPMMAGFGQLRNPCSPPVVVVAASSPAFAEVSIHETREVDGVSRMRAVERLPVAPAATALFKPGGLHLMLMRPLAPLAEGDQVEVSFQLEDGRQIQTQLRVRKTAP